MTPFRGVDSIDASEWRDSAVSTCDRSEYEMTELGGGMGEMLDEYDSYEVPFVLSM
jgi:hypothetical protein